MRERTKRCLSTLLALVLAMSMCPTTGFADEEPALEPADESTSGSRSGLVVNSTPDQMGEETVSNEGGGLSTQNVVTTQTTAKNVKYIDEQGVEQTTADDVQVQVLSSQDDLTKDWGTTGTTWYVVGDGTTNTKVQFDNDRVTVKGDVCLILADNAELDANKGITVTGDNSLTIYAQSTGTNMGKLIANAGNSDSDDGKRAAGIGGTEGKAGGTVIINGGEVEATGNTNDRSSSGAGIGGGKEGSGGTVTINGGKVTANGGTWAAGIGGGYKANGGTVAINGGTVTATGNEAAGIGGGSIGSGGTVTITKGEVTAIGGKSGAGIGGGDKASNGGGGNGGTVTIEGGTVTAIGGANGAGIGGGGGNGGTVTIKGGTVTAEGKNGGKGIGAGHYGNSNGDVNIWWTISVLAGNSKDNAEIIVPSTKFEEKHDQAWVQTTVTVPIESMEIEPETQDLTVDETAALEAIITPDEATNKTWCGTSSGRIRTP